MLGVDPEVGSGFKSKSYKCISLRKYGRLLCEGKKLGEIRMFES